MLLFTVLIFINPNESDPSIPETQLLQNFTLKIQGQGHGWSQGSRSYIVDPTLYHFISFCSMSIEPSIPEIWPDIKRRPEHDVLSHVWIWLIRCESTKWMQHVLWMIQSGHDPVYSTEVWMDRLTRWNQYITEMGDTMIHTAFRWLSARLQ